MNLIVLTINCMMIYLIMYLVSFLKKQIQYLLVYLGVLKQIHFTHNFASQKFQDNCFLRWRLTKKEVFRRKKTVFPYVFIKFNGLHLLQTIFISFNNLT